MLLIEPGTAPRILRSRSGFALFVRGGEPARVLDGLQHFAASLRSMGRAGEGPAFVSSPISTPEGAFLHIDGGGLTTAELRSLPQLLIDRLEAASVIDAAVSTPGRSELFVGLSGQPHATVLMVYPRFTRPQMLDDVVGLPQSWAEDLVAWAGAGVETVQVSYGGAADLVLPLDAALEQASTATEGVSTCCWSGSLSRGCSTSPGLRLGARSSSPPSAPR